jgi:hypothetical protein
VSVQLLLCVRHATQVAANLEAPTHACFPKPQWFGQDGVIQECEARYGPNPKIIQYIAEQTAERRRT